MLIALTKRREANAGALVKAKEQAQELRAQLRPLEEEIQRLTLQRACLEEKLKLLDIRRRDDVGQYKVRRKRGRRAGKATGSRSDLGLSKHKYLVALK